MASALENIPSAMESPTVVPDLMKAINSSIIGYAMMAPFNVTTVSAYGFHSDGTEIIIVVFDYMDFTG